MKGKWLVVTVALLCVGLMSQTLLAQPQDRGTARGGFGGGQGGPGMRGGGMGMFGNLDLTEEQQAQMTKIREEMMAKMQDATPEQRREVFAQMREKMQAILTPEQKEKMGTMMGGMGQGPAGDTPGGLGARQPQGPRQMGPLDFFDAISRRLELTEEQQTKIAKLREDAMKKLMNDIKAVLTDKQKETFDQAQQRFAQMQRQQVQQQNGAEGTDRPARDAGAQDQTRTRTRGGDSQGQDTTTGDRPPRDRTQGRNRQN